MLDVLCESRGLIDFAAVRRAYVREGVKDNGESLVMKRLLYIVNN